MMDVEEIRGEFRKKYGRESRVFSAPGRVNLIGEHTDYNDGFVLPMAIDRRTYAAAAARDDRRVRCCSMVLGEPIEFEIGGDFSPAPEQQWGRYVHGIYSSLLSDEFELAGADILISGDVPFGAGLGSSAALEIAVGYAALKISYQVIDLVDLAVAAQRAEQEFTGTQCGIMDQYISCLGVRDHALLIDCRNLEYRAIPIRFDHARIIVCNTMVRHMLTSSEYNQRRVECEEGVKGLAAHISQLQSLRDVGIEEFDLWADSLPGKIRLRCNHVITEIARTLEAGAALESGDPVQFGKLMYASHESLRRDYEVSCRELDLMVEIASRCEGTFGARMTGGGFGGCTVNLVADDKIEAFTRTILDEYLHQTGIKPEFYLCRAAGGVREET